MHTVYPKAIAAPRGLVQVAESFWARNGPQGGHREALDIPSCDMLAPSHWGGLNMIFTGTLTEFFMLLLTGCVLLIVCAILSSGISAPNGKWVINKAHWVFTVAFGILVILIFVLAVINKYGRTSGNGVEINQVRWNIADGKKTVSSSNRRRTELMPEERDVHFHRWVIRATTACTYDGDPDIAVSLVQFDPVLAKYRYLLEAIPTDHGEYDVELTVWDITEEDVSKFGEFTIDCTIVGKSNGSR